MFQFELFMPVLIIIIIQAATSIDHFEVQRSSRQPWFLDEIENLEKNVDEANDIAGAWQYYRSTTLSNLIHATNTKTAKIYNKRGFLAIDNNGDVYTTTSFTETEATFKVKIYDLKNGKARVRLQNKQYSTYIAISCNTGKVYSTPLEKNVETIMIYTPGANTRATFQSAKCSNGSNFWYLGVKKDGTMKNAKAATANDTATNFELMS